MTGLELTRKWVVEGSYGLSGLSFSCCKIRSEVFIMGCDMVLSCQESTAAA